MNILGLIYSAGEEHTAEYHHQYQKDYREDNVYRLRRITACVLKKAHRGDHKADNSQQTVQHTTHKITSNYQKAKILRRFGS